MEELERGLVSAYQDQVRRRGEMKVEMMEVI